MALIQLGVNTCFAVKRWPEPDIWAKIIANDLELDHIQFSYDLLDPRTREPIRTEICNEIMKVTQRYGLKVDTTFTGLVAYSFNLMMHPNLGIRLDAIDWYEQAILVASKLGAKGTGGHFGAQSCKDHANKEKREQLETFLIESLQYLSKIVVDHGQEFLLWEPMPISREPPYTMEGAKRFYERVNNGSAIPIKYCIDLGHQCAWNAYGKDRDPYAWIRELCPISPVLHLQQTDGVHDCHWPFTKHYNQKGIIDAKKVIEAIEESGVKEEMLILEIVHPFEAKEDNVIEDLKESCRYWKEYL